MSKDIIYIVGGGPSLKGYDWNLLVGKRIIAINRAFQVLPNAEYVYFSDVRFFDWYKESLLQHKGLKITGGKIDHPAVVKYKFTGISGLDTRPGHLKSGNNSLYAAMNLAYHLGVNTIVLLGLDMCFSATRETHWHSGYITVNMVRQFPKMKPFFVTIAGPLEDRRISVLNANMDSEITCFEKIPLGEAHFVA